MIRHRILVAAGCLLVVIGSLAPAPWADSQDPPQTQWSTQLQSKGKPSLVDEGMTKPVLKTKVPPVYPADAKEQRIEGRVILQAVIRRDGKLDQVQVLRAENPGHGFEEAAIRAVKQWIYEPATKDGEPVDVYFTVIVEFSLK